MILLIYVFINFYNPFMNCLWISCWTKITIFMIVFKFGNLIIGILLTHFYFSIMGRKHAKWLQKIENVKDVAAEEDADEEYDGEHGVGSTIFLVIF